MLATFVFAIIIRWPIVYENQLVLVLELELTMLTYVTQPISPPLTTNTSIIIFHMFRPSSVAPNPMHTTTTPSTEMYYW